MMDYDFPAIRLPIFSNEWKKSPDDDRSMCPEENRWISITPENFEIVGSRL